VLFLLIEFVFVIKLVRTMWRSVAERRVLSLPSNLASPISAATLLQKRYAGTSSSPKYSISGTVDLYKRLRVQTEASSAEIKAAYRKRALECHPDVVSVSEKAAAEAEFRRVSEAYAVLSNALERVAYDARAKQETEKKMQEKSGVSANRGLSPRRAAAAATRRTGFTTPAAAPSGTTDTSAAGNESDGSSWRTARTFQQQKQKKNSFVRKDADRFFRDAFDGRTLDDVLFQARVRERRAESARKKKYPSNTGPAASGSRSGDNGQEGPVGHEEVLHRVLGNAAKQFADRLAKEYGHETVKKTKFVRFRGAPAEPPSDTLPFRPFIGVPLPAGVTAPPEPTCGLVTHVSEEDVDRVANESVAPEVTSERIMPKGSLHPSTRSQALHRNREAGFMAHNAGQVYSFHRIY
jgi:curved DNA-binding protein CbpA